MLTSLKNCLTVFAITMLAVMQMTLTSSAQADTLADSYNAFIFGNFTAQSSDVEGRVAVGGNMDVNNYSVGDKLSGAMVGGSTLIVGGDLHYRGGQVYHGNTLVGGTYTGPGYPLSVSPYTVSDNVSPLPVNFAGTQASLTALSAQLAALDTTGTASVLWSSLNVTGSGNSQIQVFNFDSSQLNSVSELNYITGSAPTDATLIFNISGTDPELTNMGINGLASVRENVIFNFYEATSLAIGGVGVQGSILAPLADVNSSWAVVWGQVVAKSWTGPTQINQVYFGGELPIPDPYDSEDGPTDPAPNTGTPEPTTLGLLVMGMTGALLTTRRRRQS